MNGSGTFEAVRVYRFGAFEVDLEAAVLRKRGLRFKLQDKPFQILTLLLEKAGKVVTRQELREKLWPPDTFVGFDRSLNTAVNKLRQVLGDSAANPRFIETLSRRGYCFIAPVEAAESVTTPPQASAFVDSIAVLPFQNSGGDPEMEYLSDGMTENILNSLSRLPGIRVMARSTVFRYKGRAPDPQAVGRELNVRAVLTGWVDQRGDRLSVTVELVDAEKGWRLWGEQYNRKSSDILSVQEEISGEISEKLRSQMTGDEKPRLTKRYTESAEAYLDYLRGRFHCNKMTEEGLKKGIDYFQQAIQKDRNYALAYAGLADAYGLYGFFSLLPPVKAIPRAKEAILKALELDEGLPEAHASLAGIKKLYEWDWAAAEKEYLRALELDPNHAMIHNWYADFLSAIGRTQPALEEVRRAHELEPLSIVISNEVAWNFYMARQYDQAIEQAARTIEMEPNFAPAYFSLGLAYEQAGLFDDAISAFEKARARSGSNPAAVVGLVHAYAASGRENEAKQSLQELLQMAMRGYVPSYWRALAHAALGETEAAFDWLDKACQERDVWLVWLKVEPRFDVLRCDPRFDELIRRMGFPT